MDTNPIILPCSLARAGKKARIRRENKNHKKQRLATLKRLKRGDDNELERSLRLEKVVASKQLRLAVETEEQKRARLENDGATKWLRWPWRWTKKEKQDWRRS